MSRETGRRKTHLYQYRRIIVSGCGDSKKFVVKSRIFLKRGIARAGSDRPVILPSPYGDKAAAASQRIASRAAAGYGNDVVLRSRGTCQP